MAEEKWAVTHTGTGFFFWDDENILKLTVVIGIQLCEKPYTKTSLTCTPSMDKIYGI